MSKEGVAAVDRALGILDVFTPDDHGLTLTEISKRAGYYKSTTLRLAESLEKFGYLQRMQDGTYQLGAKPLRLGSLYQRQFRTSDYVPPVLREVVTALGEGASFYIRDGSNRVCLHKVESKKAIRDSVHEGDTLPLSVGASGLVLRAFAHEAGAELDTVRKRFYAATFGQRDPETAAYAVPVFGVGGEVAGALAISGPRYRIEALDPGKVVTVLWRHGQALTDAFGGAADSYPAKFEA